MEYKVGQAVIITFSFEKQMLLVYQETIGDYIKASGLINPKDSATVLIDSTRAATTDEILAEAQKHGWLKGKRRDWMINSPSDKLYIADIDGWEPQIKYAPLPNEWAIFGNECITAHRLITALNLCNNG